MNDCLPVKTGPVPVFGQTLNRETDSYFLFTFLHIDADRLDDFSADY
jgi:hypothetical protein